LTKSIDGMIKLFDHRFVVAEERIQQLSYLIRLIQIIDSDALPMLIKDRLLTILKQDVTVRVACRKLFAISSSSLSS
jgi:hypothetical protein